MGTAGADKQGNSNNENAARGDKGNYYLPRGGFDPLNIMDDPDYL